MKTIYKLESIDVELGSVKTGIFKHTENELSQYSAYDAFHTDKDSVTELESENYNDVKKLFEEKFSQTNVVSTQVCNGFIVMVSASAICRYTLDENGDEDNFEYLEYSK